MKLFQKVLFLQKIVKMVKIIVKRHLTNLVMLCTLLYASLPKQNEKFLRLLVFGFTISSEKVSRGDQKNLWILRSAEKSSGAL